MKPAHIEILYSYVRYCTNVGRNTISQFQRKYYPSKKKKTIAKIINNARGKNYYGPWIFVLKNCYVVLERYERLPVLDRFCEIQAKPSVFNCAVLMGAFSLVMYEVAENSPPGNSVKLSYAESIVPAYPAVKTVGELDLSTYSREKLPEMSKPIKWDDLDWGIYKLMRNPNVSSVKVARELHVSYKTVLERFYKILQDCTVWMPFFPREATSYKQFVVTLETDYEAGLRNELSKLDRSSYVYKFGSRLLLYLNLDQNKDLNFLLDLEKDGLIHSASASIPLRDYNSLW